MEMAHQRLREGLQKAMHKRLPLSSSVASSYPAVAPLPRLVSPAPLHPHPSRHPARLPLLHGRPDVRESNVCLCAYLHTPPHVGATTPDMWRNRNRNPSQPARTRYHALLPTYDVASAEKASSVRVETKCEPNNIPNAAVRTMRLGCVCLHSSPPSAANARHAI
ncbi:hypothetical protein BDW02DRAFT_396930 [Decorospora gaudefroyi]|uniref:Uncharacterized protein n=1 Tax=Decorospora gaudefroyi TaxID=184978 RepID=A0A6A5K8W2_9PLEO|nr:hypothetical protein BDW02DRAFT_396930 [Decorospora gaudefroyi]